ncbi:hypothetical protein HY251_21755 [bacterium]|nr:hypothetical protein [bacterium]
MARSSVSPPVLTVGVLSAAFAGAMVGCLSNDRSEREAYPAVASTSGPRELGEHGSVALLVKGEPGKPAAPLHVSSLKADVVVVGGVATTTLDITFRNDLDRVLEGELVLPLPEGAGVSRFALEVNGALREASVVEREKARVAFEEVVRRGVDPGLVEWCAGNAFRMRVYPIPARGTKRLVLGYEQELAAGARGRASYVLPLRFESALDAFDASVSVHGSQAPSVVGSLPLAASRGASGAWQGSIATRGTRPGDLRLDFASPSSPEVAIETARVSTESLAFVARVPVPEVRVAIFQGYGLPDERRLEVTRRLTERSEVIAIEELDVR